MHWKKTTPLEIVQLMQQVGQASTYQLRQAVSLPQDVRLDFDAASERAHDLHTTSGYPAAASHVLKTSQRTVVSLQQGRFEAREIVRQLPGDDSNIIQRSMQQAAGSLRQ